MNTCTACHGLTRCQLSIGHDGEHQGPSYLNIPGMRWGQKRSLYTLRCRECNHQAPEAYFNPGSRTEDRICPKCGSSRTFPTNEQKMHFDTSHRRGKL